MATATVTRVNDAHRLYVKSLYKRYLTNALNWAVQRDVWRQQALEIRAEFDKHKYVSVLSVSGMPTAPSPAGVKKTG